MHSDWGSNQVSEAIRQRGSVTCWIGFLVLFDADGNLGFFDTHFAWAEQIPFTYLLKQSVCRPSGSQWHIDWFWWSVSWDEAIRQREGLSTGTLGLRPSPWLIDSQTLFDADGTLTWVFEMIFACAEHMSLRIRNSFWVFRGLSLRIGRLEVAYTNINPIVN